MKTFLVTARVVLFWLDSTLSTGFYGFVCAKTKSIKIPVAVGFLLLTSGMIGLTTIEPDDWLHECDRLL